MRAQLLLPYAMGGEAARLRHDGEVHREEYTPDGLLLDVTASIRMLQAFQSYMQ